MLASFPVDPGFRNSLSEDNSWYATSSSKWRITSTKGGWAKSMMAYEYVGIQFGKIYILIVVGIMFCLTM